jgi:hypothetical protein
VFLKFFKSSFVAQYVFIAVIGLVLWCRAFITPVQMPPPDSTAPVYSIIYYLLSGYPVLAAMLGYMLILGSAILLNYIFTRHEIVAKNSSLAAFFFIVLASYYPAMLTLHPVNICIFILLLVFRDLFESYHQVESLDLIYAAGFFTGLGSFIYFPFLVFYALIILSFLVFRSNSWREWVSSLIGLLTPYVFLSVYYFWFDEFKTKVIEYSRFFRLPQDFHMEAEPLYLIFTAILLLFLLFAFSVSLSHLSEKTIEGRKKSLLVFWAIFFVLISFPFAGVYYLLHLQFLVVIASILLTYYFLQRKKTTWIELLFLLFFAAIILNNLIFSYI